MLSFLEQTVRYLHDKYGDDISELCIVLPNRRAGLFLKTHLAKTLNKTFWAPEIYATEDFVALLSGLQPADPTTLLFDLYETVRSCNPNHSETFDEFSKWGQVLLSDLNEIDRYLVDADQLFGNLKDIKELESWSLNSDEPLTEFQKQYLDFWFSLAKYYKDFTKRILAKRQAYQGLAYRVVAADAEKRILQHPWKKVIFAGFNALNLAEEVIIEKLIDIDRAEILWDVDSYYADDTSQEAGRFFRRYDLSGKFKKFPDRNTVFRENLLAEARKKVVVIGAARIVAQAKVAGNIISDLREKQESLQNTALVLADENLLFPVLHSLPAALPDINVTMGYPLRNTPVAGYFDLVFSLHENAQRISNSKKNYSFYHSDLTRFLSHPYTALAMRQRGNRPAGKLAVRKLQARNIIFASLKNIAAIFKEEDAEDFEMIAPVFKSWEGPEDAVECVHFLINALKDGIVAQTDRNATNKESLELEYLFAYTKIFKRIQVLMTEFPGTVHDIATLRGVLGQIVKSSTLPFYGEPLMGLQVMGMLETRTLDFENIILLSCNEDILPSGKAMNSFIPFELKRHFGLPTYGDKDAIFAYHFYRLLQRASTIYLIYNTESDALGSGEKSRFLTQLIYELPKVNPNVEISEKLLSVPAAEVAEKKMDPIWKSPAIMDKLKAKAEYGLSPSALNRYRNCQMQFYFQAVAGLKESEEIEETIGADVLGNVIHKVLEQLYLPFVGKNINAEDVAAMRPQVEDLTIAAFKEYYDEAEISYGKNLLTLKVALRFISNFLSVEADNLRKLKEQSVPLLIRSLEQDLETVIDLHDIQVKIRGKADRIDQQGAMIRIVDYKTGQAKDTELRFEDFAQLKQEEGLDKSFQLLMYALMYQRMNPAIRENISSGIITFRELSAGLKTVNAEGSKTLNAESLDKFEEQLKEILAEIFNKDKPFEQTSDPERCEYCSFKGICNR